MTGWTARRLGGGRFAQLLAALHETYALWGPGDQSGEQVISVGIPERVMGRYYGDVEQVGVAHTKYAQPHENVVPVLLCRGPKEGRTLREVWPEFQRFH